MPTITEKDAVKTITTHYIDGAFVESHGRTVMDIVKPANGQVIGWATLGDEEDTRRAIAAAKRAFARFSRTTKQERLSYLKRLHRGCLSTRSACFTLTGSKNGFCHDSD